MKTWVIVGASRGIGHEFVKQLLQKGDCVLATVRSPLEQTAASLWPEAGRGKCDVFECDMLSEKTIDAFASQLARIPDLKIDYLILNAGVLKYPSRATEMSYADFTFHLQTNTVGPIITAQRLLATKIAIGAIVFISSDSGSVSKFNSWEDGFAGYSASKAAENQALRHMAAELERKGVETIVLALHPGEVKTDMASIDVSWEVEGQITVTQSVAKCLQTIESKGKEDHGTFWTWENKQYPW